MDKPTKGKWQTTHKEIFDELYDKYIDMKPKARKWTIYEDMKQLFDNDADLCIFIKNNCFRRWRNVVVRRQRFARKNITNIPSVL